MGLHFVYSSRFSLIGDTLQTAFRNEFGCGDYRVVGSDSSHGRAVIICPDQGYGFEERGRIAKLQSDDEVHRLMARFANVPVPKRTVRIFIASRQILWCEGLSDSFEPKTTEALWSTLKVLEVKRCSVTTYFSVTYAHAPEDQIWAGGVSLEPMDIDPGIVEKHRLWSIANPDDPSGAIWKLIPFSAPPLIISDVLVRIVRDVRSTLVSLN
jgi:hypothetical protein